MKILVLIAFYTQMLAVQALGVPPPNVHDAESDAGKKFQRVGRYDNRPDGVSGRAFRPWRRIFEANGIKGCRV